VAVRADDYGGRRVVLCRERCARCQRTSAPSAVRVSINTAVWTVMVQRTPNSGPLQRLHLGVLRGAATSGQAISARRSESLRPKSASRQVGNLKSDAVNTSGVSEFSVVVIGVSHP